MAETDNTQTATPTTNMEGKFARIGTKNLTIALLNDQGLVVGEPLLLQGTTEADISINAENATLSADDGAYLTLSSGIQKVTLKLSNYLLTPKAKQMLLGTKYAMGMEVFGSDTNPNHVAVMFETQLVSNESHPLYMGLLNGTFKFPESKNKTKGTGAPDPSPDEIEGEFVLQTRGSHKVAQINGYSSDPDFDLTTFRNLVMPKTQEDLDAAIQAYETALNKVTTPVTTPGN